VNKHALSDFKEIWCCDFEYQHRVGELPVPICMVVHEINSGTKIRLWLDQLENETKAPFPVGDDSLFVAFFATAEFSCFHALSWDLPIHCLDLFVEFRNLTNLHSERRSASLLAALNHFGFDSLGYDEKESMRSLAMRGGPYTESERSALLDYCATDVVALEKLLPVMAPNINLPQALLRGKYMCATSVMEKTGVPIDNGSLQRLQSNWSAIENSLIERIDRDFGVFEGRSFRRDRFEAFLKSKGYSWIRDDNGELLLDEDTFKEMTKVYPDLCPLKELRHTLSQLRLSRLAVGKDAKNRTSLSPFRATTSRNQPSNAEFIFGPSRWIRGLIQPPTGWSLLYLDWCQQEFGIAAALSRDPKMMLAYTSGDPYLEFGKQAGAIPPEGTKKSHELLRDQFKQCTIAVQYGMTGRSLALRIDKPRIEAHYLLQLHRETYPRFWKWSDAVVTHAMLTGKLQTVFGWSLHIGANVNERSIRNFPMQANGAEMLRLACCLMVQAGLEVCAPVHDAILIAAPTAQADKVCTTARDLMERASQEVLGGFKLRTDEKIISSPDRFMDPRGEVMWNTVWDLIGKIEI